MSLYQLGAHSQQSLDAQFTNDNLSSLEALILDLYRGRVYDARTYGTFANAISTIGAVTKVTLIISSDMTISTPVNVTSNIHVRVLGGGSFTKSATGTLTFATFDAPNKQIFFGFSAGDIAFDTSTNINPLWAGGDNTIMTGTYKTVQFNVDSATPLNNVTRLRMSDWNFITNSSFESWTSGTNVAPDGWYLSGTATVARSGTAIQGSYSAQITFGAANDGEFYAIFAADTSVDYTFSAYVTRISGTGIARLVAQQNFGAYTEDISVAMSTSAGNQLVTLTFTPSAKGNYRISFKSANSNSSVWRIDEVKVQESKGIATTWTPNFIDDSFAQNIWAQKSFKVPTGTAPFNVDSRTPVGNLRVEGLDIVASGSIPAAGASQDGKVIIEDNGAGDRNLIVYAGGQRFRIDGGAAF